jgi:hypothetical protein
MGWSSGLGSLPLEGAFSRSHERADALCAALPNLFKFILRSPGYAERLKKHYQLFRAAVDEEYAKRNPTLQFPEVQRRAR